MKAFIHSVTVNEMDPFISHVPIVKIQVSSVAFVQRIMGKNISGEWYVVVLILIGHFGKNSGL